MRMQAMGMTNPFLLGLGGAVSGGATAALTGGDWGMAAFQGFMVGMFNHGGKDLDDWMTVDKDGKRKILNNKLPEVVIEGKMPPKSFNEVIHSNAYTYGMYVASAIESISEICKFEKTNSLFSNITFGFEIANLTNTQFQFYCYKSLPMGRYIWDTISSGALIITKGNPYVATSVGVVNFYYSVFQYCAEAVNRIENNINYRMKHPYTFMFNPTLP